MKKYQVNITDGALKDMEQIYDYIAYVLLSPRNALGQYKRIASSIERLDLMPECFKIIDLGKEHFKDMRRMLVDNYSVFYVIRENQVIVTNVLYSASDIEQRLRFQI